MKMLSIELQIDLWAFASKVSNINAHANGNPRATLLELKLEAQALKRRCVAENEGTKS